MGGLGIGNIVLKNKALLGKWIWRFTKEENSFWHSRILCKYETGPNGWDSNPTPSPRTSAIWKHILDTRPLVYSHRSLVIGDGRRFWFWSNTWIGDCPLGIRFPCLFRLASNKTASISDILSNSTNGLSWNLFFTRTLITSKLETVSSLHDCLASFRLFPSRLDYYKWSLNSSGLFTVKSLHISLSSNTSPNPLHPSLYPIKFVWNDISPQGFKPSFGLLLIVK